MGGRHGVAVAIAVVAALSFNVAFIRPYWTFKVAAWDDWIALWVFVAVAFAIGVLVAAQTEHRRAVEQREIELRALYENLAREVARADVLEQVGGQRSALLRSVSHDLRTPLATIRAVVVGPPRRRRLRRRDARPSCSRTVVRRGRAARPSRRQPPQHEPHRGGRARSPSGRPSTWRSSIADRVRRLGTLCSTTVRLQVDIAPDLPLVDGDYTQLEQVLTNLLENAARYAPPRVDGSRSRPGRDGGMVELSVADEGIGIPEFERARVFEPFRRGEGSRSSGVGLAICKAIVEAHGGTIAVDRTRRRRRDVRRSPSPSATRWART